MPGGDQDHQLQSSSSHHERTYILSSQECQEQIKTISFIPSPATMTELTHCQVNDPTSISNVHNESNFVTVKKSCHTAPPLTPIASLTTCTSMYYYNYWWIINALSLWQIPIQHSLGAIEIPPPHSLNDCQMERSFHLPPYVETTLQFPSALECTYLSIPASTLEMLCWCKPALPCITNMSDPLES